MPAATSIAVVGSGPWALRHMATIEAAPELHFAGVVSKSLTDGSRPPPVEASQAPIWGDINEMVAHGALPDGVVLATQPSVMRELSTHLITLGLPVLAEKPLAESAADAAYICDLARNAEVPLMVNFIHLFSNGYRELKRHLSEIGNITRIDSKGGNQGPFRPYLSALWDYGPHELAFIFDLLSDDPVSLKAKLVTGDRHRHNVNVLLRFPNGIDASLEFGNLMTSKHRRLTCSGTAGSALLEDYPAPVLQVSGQAIPLIGASPLVKVLLQFAETIRSKEDPYKTADLACRVNRYLEQIETEIFTE